MAPLKSASLALTLIAFITGTVTLTLPWVCYYIYHVNRLTAMGDAGMGPVLVFLVVTPVVMLSGGFVGSFLLRRFHRTPYAAALKVSGVLIWLVFIACVALQTKLSALLARAGKASYKQTESTVVTDLPTAK
ncbi:MAG TPA: hypothetical protein VF681_07610 [Abditibacteriaceae bacterium]